MTSQDAVSALKVQGLTKRYGTRQVLAGVNLEVARGETYALLGPNGAGKSTTIEMLEGRRRPDSGTVEVLGQDPLRAPRAWKSRVGIVTQATGDMGPYSPRELIDYFGLLAPNPRPTDEVLELVGLTEHAGRKANKLSGGQQRRLDVALGIVGRPEFLFLDEPTTGFDPEARHQLWGMLSGLAADGTSILLTTHYLDEAAHLADRVGVLAGGVIVAEAPPQLLGGAEARVPVVRWQDETGAWREQRTEAPGALVSELSAAGEPVGLEVRRPSLEDIYLGLIAEHAQVAAGTPSTNSAAAPLTEKAAR